MTDAFHDVPDFLQCLNDLTNKEFSDELLGVCEYHRLEQGSKT